MNNKDRVYWIIRRLCPDDLDETVKIWLNGNLDAHDFISAEYWRGATSSVRAALARAEVYVCEDAATRAILGFVGMTGEYLEGIFVRASNRSQGVGRSLLDYVKETRDRIVLKVYRQNERALRFYLREGFERSAEGLDVATRVIETTLVWRRD